MVLNVDCGFPGFHRLIAITKGMAKMAEGVMAGWYEAPSDSAIVGQEGMI